MGLPTRGTLGGGIYTLGVIFYAWQRLPYNHAIRHVSVPAGSACHFACVLGYVRSPTQARPMGQNSLWDRPL